MFAFGGESRLLPGAAQGVKGKHFSIQSIGIGGRRDIGYVIESAGLEGSRHAVNHARIVQRTICREPNDNVRLAVLRGLKIAVENIIRAAAKAVKTVCSAVVGYRVVFVIGRGRDQNVVHAPRQTCPARDMRQHRFARDLMQHFAGQTRRPHARLDDGDHFLPPLGTGINGIWV